MSQSCKLVRSQNPDSLLIRCSTHGWVGDQTEWDGISPCPYALGAAANDDSEAVSAPPAVSRTTATIPSTGNGDVPPTVPGSEITRVSIQSSDASGSTEVSNVGAFESQPSKPSDEPSAPSTRHWGTPRTAMEFAGQANRVATMILNGEIDVDTGRLYSSVARTVAQALSTEVSRARYLQNEPNLTFPEEVPDGPEEDGSGPSDHP